VKKILPTSFFIYNPGTLRIADLAILGILCFFTLRKEDFFFVLAVAAKEQVSQSSAARGAAKATG